MSRPRDRMSSERRRARDGPSARAVGQEGEPKEPDVVGRISGGGLSFGDFSLATQRKVTRPSPKGGRNPFEAGGLASCTARPCHHTTAPTANTMPRNGRLRLTANRPYDGAGCIKTPPQPSPSQGRAPRHRSQQGARPNSAQPLCRAAARPKGGLAAPIGPKTPPSP
ncbi:hypothetical protein D3C85_784370 [compost metagenome]